jgi:hypothetical protein
MSIRTLLPVFTASVFLSSAFAQTTTANTREFDFPAIAFGSTETLEINAINVAANSANGTAASCTGSIAFHNAAGTAVGAATSFTLTAGQISTARLPFANAGSAAGRAAVRAVVQVTIPAATPRPPCSLQLSLEIFDSSTNATHVYINGGGLGTAGRF